MCSALAPLTMVTPCSSRAREAEMIELVILIVVFVGLFAGGVAAAMAGRLPTAKQLAEEDEERFARYKRALER